MYTYLSSFSVGNRARELRSLVRVPKAAVIANALDHNEGGDLRRSFAQNEIAALQTLGFEAHELDLREYFDNPKELRRRLETVGLVWATGGNVFLLRRAMKQSGLDRCIEEYRRRDDFVYGGFSAGACVAAPTLRGCELVDTLNVSVRGYGDEVVWDGLGLVPYSIVPHFESDHPDAALVTAMIRHFVQNGMPYVTLRDGDAIVVSTAA